MKDNHWITTNYIAHRGLHDSTHPENTLAAFERAVLHGFDIELDIRLTKDNQLVVIHDNNLQRLCNVAKHVSKMEYSEIAKLRINQTNHTIPLLTDVLNIVPSSHHLMIELKSGPKNRTLVRELKRVMEKYNHEYVVLSFNPIVVNLCKKELPDILRGQIAKKYHWFPNVFTLLLTNLCFNFLTKPDFIIYKIKDLPRKKLDTLYQKGMIVLTYTARSEQELEFVRKRYHNAVFEHFIPKK